MPKTNQPTWVSKTGQNKVLLSDAAMQTLKNNPIIAKRFYDLMRNCQDPREFVFQVNQFIYDLRQRGFSLIDQKFLQRNQPNQADLSTIQNMQAELNNPNSLASMFAVEAAAAVVNAVQAEMAVEQQTAIQNTNDAQSENVTSTVLSDVEKITAMATIIAVFEKKAPEEIFNGFEKKEEAGAIFGAFEKITGKKGVVEDFLKKEIGVSETATTKPMPPIRKIFKDEDKK